MSNEFEQHVEEARAKGDVLRQRAGEQAAHQRDELRAHAEETREHLKEKQEQMSADLKQKNEELRSKTS